MVAPVTDEAWREAAEPIPLTDVDRSLIKTRQLVAAGLSPEGIARARGVKVQDIYRDLETLIKQGEFRVQQLLSGDVISEVIRVLGRQQPRPSVAFIQRRLPGRITLGMIRCVLAALDSGTLRTDSSSS